MDLKHANGEQMTVEKLISFVPCEKKEFFSRIENPTKLSSTGTTQIFSKKGRVAWKIALFSAWDWRLLFLAGEEELTSKNPIVPSKFQGDKLLLRFSIISFQIFAPIVKEFYRFHIMQVKQTTHTSTLFLFFLFLFTNEKLYRKPNQSIFNHFSPFRNHFKKVRLNFIRQLVQK